MIVSRCDLCEQTRECFPKEIDGREYDICAACWEELSRRLSGKGRPPKSREMVILPPTAAPREEEPEKPAPDKPPRIWYGSDRQL